MSLECADESSWAEWAAAHDLPQEIIMLVKGPEDAEQGWPPGMMDEVSSKSLHEIGIKNTRFVFNLPEFSVDDRARAPLIAPLLF
jgi:hypothetical protein